MLILHVVETRTVPSEVPLDAATTFIPAFEQLLIIDLVGEEFAGVVQFLGPALQLKPLFLGLDRVS